MAFADIDADGVPDLQLAEPEMGRVRLLASRGADYVHRQTLSVGNMPSGVHALKTTRGDDDLLVAAWQSRRLHRFERNQLEYTLAQTLDVDGTYVELLEKGGAPAKLAVTGVNADSLHVFAWDGQLEEVGRLALTLKTPRGLAVASGSSGDYYFVTNTALDNLLVVHEGRDGLALKATIETPSRPRQVVATDLTRDGAFDVVLAAATDGLLRVWINPEQDGWSTPRDLAVEKGPRTLAIADVDGDRVEDLVVGHSEGVFLGLHLCDEQP